MNRSSADSPAPGHSRSGTVAIVIDSMDGGGAQRVVAQLLRHWTDAGCRVRLITFLGPGSDFFPVPDAVTRIVIGGVGASSNALSGLFSNVRRMWRLRRAIRASGADTVVSFIAGMNVLAILASRGLGVRVIACERNDPSRQFLGPIWDRLRRFTYPRADLVTANSRGVIDALRQFVPEQRLAYVPNPLPPPQSDVAAPAAGPMVLTVGRLQPAKAQDVLLRAFGAFHARHPDWRLAIVGRGPQETALRALASDIGIAGAVDWIGEVDDPYPWLRAARIFALPSRFEGMPNALLEAMACGLPCVVSDSSPGPLELISDGRTGLVVPVEDHHALAAAFARLAGEPGLAATLGEAARMRVGEFAPAEALPAWDAVIGVCDRGRAAAGG